MSRSVPGCSGIPGFSTCPSFGLREIDYSLVPTLISFRRTALPRVFFALNLVGLYLRNAQLATV